MNYSNILYKLVTKDTREKKVSVLFFDFLINACQNRLLYWFSKNYRNSFDEDVDRFLNQISSVGDQKINKLNKTLDLIQSISQEGNLNYIIAKYDRTLPYISSDIDLLIEEEDMDTWATAFRKREFLVTEHKEFLKEKIYQKTVYKKDYYKIDLTVQFCWQNKLYFSPEFFWKDYDYKKHRLSNEADFLVNLATLIFKRMHFNILDYMYLSSLMNKNLNWNQIEDQVRRFRWQELYKKMLDFLRFIDPEKEKFPKLFPLTLCFTIFKENLSNREFSINSFLYFALSRLRYYINGEYLPYHVYWYPLKNLKKVVGRKIQI